MNAGINTEGKNAKASKPSGPVEKPLTYAQVATKKHEPAEGQKVRIT
jgi:hypothetical protein